MHNFLSSLAVLIFYNYCFTIPIITYAALNVRIANETRCIRPVLPLQQSQNANC